MQLRWLAVLIGLAVLATSACTSLGIGSRSPVIDRIRKNGEIRVGMTGDYPPLNALDTSNRNIGLEPDLAQALAATIGVDLVVVNRPFAELIPALEAGEVDAVMSGMTMTPARNMDVAFAGPYFISGKAVLTHSESLSRIATPSELDRPNLTLSVLAGTTSQTFVERAIPRAKVVTTKDYGEAVAMVIDGRVDAMLADYPLRGASLAQRVERRAAALVEGVRRRRSDHTLLDTFLQEYGLANDEGVALMCLAESLLRVPDPDTMDALIKDKILPANWADHLGDSASILVNASTWGLMLTGKVIGMHSWPSQSPGDFIGHLLSRLGEPVIRASMQRAMHILGREFVLGRTIVEALERGAGGLFSFDMLGEAARTAQAAQNYFDVYSHAVEAVGGAASRGSGVSVKLSALHPRYQFVQYESVMTQLFPRLLSLCETAAQHDIALSIDAEEADRLELSLELFERIARAPTLAGWEGLGIVVQAYGKRALPCIAWVEELARQTHRRINVRLVKGAYWDAEIKHAQELGLDDFPVFTVKANTDIAYLVCARKLFGCADFLYPQFATHNAHTVTAIMALAAAERDFEFQRLHGMGELLYTLAAESYDAFPGLRVYAPVGGHEDLLPYLVRRLLENGANSSSSIGSWMKPRLRRRWSGIRRCRCGETKLTATSGCADPRICMARRDRTPAALIFPTRSRFHV